MFSSIFVYRYSYSFQKHNSLLHRRILTRHFKSNLSKSKTILDFIRNISLRRILRVQLRFTQYLHLQRGVFHKLQYFYVFSKVHTGSLYSSGDITVYLELPIFDCGFYFTSCFWTSVLLSNCRIGAF